MSKDKKDEAIKAATGHNSDQLLRKYVQDHAQDEIEIELIKSRQKDRLNSAKQDGFKKTAIRNTVKILRQTEKQRQAALEIERSTDEYTEKCRDLPLFAAARKNAA